jgi:hypothetical protein
MGQLDRGVKTTQSKRHDYIFPTEALEPRGGRLPRAGRPRSDDVECSFVASRHAAAHAGRSACAHTRACLRDAQQTDAHGRCLLSQSGAAGESGRVAGGAAPAWCTHTPRAVLPHVAAGTCSAAVPNTVNVSCLNVGRSPDGIRRHFLLQKATRKRARGPRRTRCGAVRARGAGRRVGALVPWRVSA